MSQADTIKGAIEAIANGLATPATVIAHWQGVLADTPELSADLAELGKMIEAMASTPDGRRILDAVCCSVLNQHYLKSWVMLRVDEKGNLESVMETSEKTRKLLQQVLLDR